MTHPFLSAEWMDAAREIRERYRDHAPKVSMVVRFNQVVTGVPFGDGTVTYSVLMRGSVGDTCWAAA